MTMAMRTRSIVQCVNSTVQINKHLNKKMQSTVDAKDEDEEINKKNINWFTSSFLFTSQLRRFDEFYYFLSVLALFASVRLGVCILPAELWRQFFNFVYDLRSIFICHAGNFFFFFSIAYELIHKRGIRNS